MIMCRLLITKQDYDKKSIHVTTYIRSLRQTSKGYVVYDNQS